MRPDVHSYPVEEIEYGEQQRVMDSILDLKAVQQHMDNFEYFKNHFVEKQVSEPAHMSKLFFTNGDPEKIKQMTQGILPKSVHELPPRSAHHAFFHSQVDIQTQMLNSVQRLKPKML